MPKTGWAAAALAGLVGGYALASSGLGNRPGTQWLDLWTGALALAIALGCGLFCHRPAGLAATTWMAVTSEMFRPFNPFVLAITFGPWLMGTILRERRALNSRLDDAGQAIEAENQRLAEEAVRLERARIARELHDILAHCVTVMVVQAYAGERLTTTDTTAAADAFDQIASTASQASREIAHLAGLLADNAAPARLDLPAAVQALTAGARAAGLDVTLDFAGTAGHVSPAAAAAAYRIVQEGITNALKHSVGSPIHISVSSISENIVVNVVNGAARSLPGRLASSGGGHGLQGIRDRVTGLGGHVEAGPEPGAGWRLRATFPAR